ncbi:unnamed protein product [Tuber melanosporum]|uniref:(Perigord truffle) hypothetical protein n=1 Tax=Tuber melanosporum (strain Mel28) TaxID=656061 RepID=D5GCV8_TUBMM|nr:uncharacterized protein GSTUM_00000795001 [Tuber melanosporum]CAZ82351.1 unnamed protein product [Tuber melanosporum]
MSLFGRINTPTSGTPSLFGGQQQQQPQTPLFGSTTTTSGSSGGPLGGASQPAAPAPGGLFGGGQAQAQTPAIGTGCGISGGAATPATSGGGGGGGGGLFGGALTPAATPAPASGGLFGTPSTTTPTTGVAPTGGLFGGATQAATSAQPAGGLFGAGTAASASAPATGGGLFGGGTSQPPPKPLFTGPSAATTSGTGAFGSTATPRPGGLFGGTTPSTTQPQQQSQQQQNTVPAATIDASKLIPTTRFGDCHAEVQRILEGIEQEIQEQIRIATELTAHFPGHRATIDSIPSDTAVLTHKLATTKSFLAADDAALSTARQHHNEDDAAATLSIRNVDLFRVLPAQRSQYIAQQHNQPMRENDITSNKPMINYFDTQIAKMDQKLDLFLESVQEVELSLRSVEEQATMGSIGGENLTALTGGVGGRQDARRLNRTLREFNDALKDVSGRIVDSKDGIRALRSRR